MAAEVMLIGVAKVALEEGVKFLYEQAREVLTAWHARRRDPSAPPPIVVPTPEQVTVGPPQPRAEPPDEAALETLQELKDAAEPIKDGQVSADDPIARQVIADLRAMLEAALRAPITIAGEAPRPVGISDIEVVTKDVSGRVAGVRAGLDQLARAGGQIKGVRVETGEVTAGGDVTGVDLT
jgi:hypothetical protein